MDYVSHSQKLKDLLELQGSPIALAFLTEKPENSKRWRGLGTVCVMIQRVRRGKSFYCSAGNIICGGRVHLGMASSTGINLQNFLVKTERLAASEIAARRLLGLSKSRTPDKSGEYLALAPLEEATFVPEVVLLIGTPLQISRVIWLDAFQTGQINTIHGEPLCSGVIGAPISRGRIGISFLDMACRSLGRYKPEEMIMGIPFNRMERIIDSIDKSMGGTAKPKPIMRFLPKLIKP